MALLIACLWLWPSAPIGAADDSPSGAALSERLGERLPLDLRLVDEHGHSCALGDLLGDGKPLIIIPGYFRCPMLCTLVLDGMATGVRQLGWTPGERFRIASISFDARETSEDAERRQDSVLALFTGWKPASGRLAPGRWPFLVASQPAIDRLLDAIGLRLARYGGQLAHPAFAVVATPDGRISRYLYGIDFPPTELRLALLEASDGKIGGIGDRLLLFCYHWDPAAHRYGWAVAGLLRAGGALTVLSMVAFWWRLVRGRRLNPAP